MIVAFFCGFNLAKKVDQKLFVIFTPDNSEELKVKITSSHSDANFTHPWCLHSSEQQHQNHVCKRLNAFTTNEIQFSK